MNKSLLLFFLLVLLFTNSNGQTEENKRLEESEILQALLKRFENPSSTNEQVDTELMKHFKDSGRIENQLKEGFWAHYSLDSASMEEQYVLVINSKNLPLFISAVLQKEAGYYKRGKREGLWTVYKSYSQSFPLVWVTSQVSNYKNGLKNGEEIIYQIYPGHTTKPLIIKQWKDNKENGIGKMYYSDSACNLQKVYRANDKGLWVLESYYPNGSMQTEFIDTTIGGVKLKYFKEYYESGNLKLNGYYSSGELAYGLWTSYYENGKIENVLHYKEGKLDGTITYYHDNGSLWTERTYKEGDLMGVVSNFSRNGKRNDPGTIKNGTGMLYVYDVNGNLIEKIEFVAGKENKRD